MKGKILVASWGYSMILTTWVKVVKEDAKTLLVAEIGNRSLTKEELADKNLSLSFMQCYMMPVEDVLKYHNGDIAPQFRLYKRGDSWKGKPSRMSGYGLNFKVWDGTPQLEDHAD